VSQLIVCHVYSVSMPWVHIHLKGAKEAIAPIWAAKLEDNDDTKQLVIYDQDNRVTGKFDKGQIAGWWTVPGPGEIGQQKS
jgi:hypothetical protein